jgi:hypothetical protein
MNAVGRRVAGRLLAGAVLAGMLLIANRPLAALDGRSHGCERLDAAASQDVVVAPVQTGCHHTDVICYAAAGCVAAAPALLPTSMRLSCFQTPGRSRDARHTPVVDLFQSGPPTPPPNS